MDGWAVAIKPHGPHPHDQTQPDQPPHHHNHHHDHQTRSTNPLHCFEKQNKNTPTPWPTCTTNPINQPSALFITKTPPHCILPPKTMKHHKHQVATMRRKYDDLVSYTVSLTAERDRLKQVRCVGKKGKGG